MTVCCLIGNSGILLRVTSGGSGKMCSYVLGGYT